MRNSRIILITPSTQPPLPQFLQLRKKSVEELVCPETEIDVTDLKKGSATIETAYDTYFSIPELLRKVKDAEDRGYDAVVITCFDDPGLDASREISSIPVVGSGEASMLLALSLGDRFSIVTIVDEGIPVVKRIVRAMGIESRLASIRSIDIPVSELGKDLEQTKKSFLEEAKRAVEIDGADVIIPGCTFFTILVKDMQPKLEVPLISPTGAAVRLAETLVRLNLRQSRKTYPAPTAKKRTA